MALQMPEFLQAKKYTAQRMRMLYGDRPLQSGVAGRGFQTVVTDLISDSMSVVPVSPSPSMNVVIKPGSAWIRGGYGARAGMYHVVNDADVTVPVDSNVSSANRIDQVILRVYDERDAPGVTTASTVEVLKGTPTVGATLTNRLGAVATLPPSSIRLADIQVDPGISSIQDLANLGEISDRRPWAFGRYYRGATGTGTWNQTIDSTNMLPAQFELASGWLRIRVYGNMSSPSGAVPAVGEIRPHIGGMAGVNATYDEDLRRITSSVLTQSMSVDAEWVFPYAPGNYRPGVWATMISGTAFTINIMTLEVTELLRDPTLDGDTS